MNKSLSAFSQPRLIQSFDLVFERFANSNISFTEEEALQKSHWEQGEDARLREDFRFRPTPWNRWILSHNLIANDALSKWFRENHKSAVSPNEALEALGDAGDRRWVLCIGDPRFKLEEGSLCLAATELTDEPLIEEPLEIQKYVTHLPVHTLKAVAASEPAGEWGHYAQEEVIETLGWLRVKTPHKLNEKMFVAQIEGNSMDDGRRGLTHGSYAVFELWPGGTRQDDIVLVKGSFTDPDTGSYTLKKYVGDVRDEEMRHQSIRLVSLNPDKNRYPDIELSPEDDESILVIAKHLNNLSGNEYGRKPKAIPGKLGRRNLTESHVVGRMRKRAKEIFGERVKEKETGPVPEQKQSRLICLDLEGGGLHVETVPLNWLPNFVKRITLQSGSVSSTLLASNLKHRTWRQMVPPSRDGYKWSAPGFEEDVAEELDQLTLPGLPENAPVLFRVDAAGIGQLMEGNRLSSGQEYRVVVPPNLKIKETPVGTIGKLDGNWQLWDFVLPMEPDEGTKRLLEKLLLEVGKTVPQISWTGIPPVSFRKTPKGEIYPCFDVGQQPVLCIRGISVLEAGDASVFVFSGDHILSAPLSEGDQFFVQFEDLPEGPALVQVLHKKTETLPASFPFFVVDEVESPVRAEIKIQMGDKSLDSDEGGQTIFQQDLGKLEQDGREMTLSGPPLWLVRYDWRADTKSLITYTHLDENGVMELDEALNRTWDRRNSFLPGDWCFDFYELGAAVLRHQPIPRPQDLMDRFKVFVEEKGTGITALKGQLPLLRTMWLEPLFPLMGLECEELPAPDLKMAPEGMTAMILFRTIRHHNGGIERTRHSILVWVANSELIALGGENSTWEYADKLCSRQQLSISIISDGILWMRHRPNSFIKGNVYNLLDIVQKEAVEDLQAFLSECGGW